MTDYADLEKRLCDSIDVDVDPHWPNKLLAEAADALASLTRKLEEAEEVRDTLAAWAIEFLASDPEVGSHAAAGVLVKEIIRKNRPELLRIRAAKADISRDSAGQDDANG